MYVVIADCGFSDWFQVRDMRTFGPFETHAEAKAWAEEQNHAHISSRDGNEVKCFAMEMGDPFERVVI